MEHIHVCSLSLLEFLHDRILRPLLWAIIQIPDWRVLLHILPTKVILLHFLNWAGPADYLWCGRLFPMLLR
jgi:hypothetical protein